MEKLVAIAFISGAWSPIGDVTTTMLWMGGRISTAKIIIKLILPSLTCLLVPLIWMTFSVKGTFFKVDMRKIGNSEQCHQF